MKKLVLLVDDEEIIRMTTGEILEELGFDVIRAGTGFEGLDVYKADNSKIDLVILDMTLPDMTGVELFSEMKKISKDAKFLLTSGYRHDMSGADDDAMFIQKPYTMTDLDNRLKEIFS
jgi:DNA-binding response OmpR family regulator